MYIKKINEPIIILNSIKTYYNVSIEFLNSLNNGVDFIEFEIKNNINKCIKLIESIVFFGCLYPTWTQIKKNFYNGFYENVLNDLKDIIQIIENNI